MPRVLCAQRGAQLLAQRLDLLGEGLEIRSRSPVRLGCGTRVIRGIVRSVTFGTKHSRGVVALNVSASSRSCNGKRTGALFLLLAACSQRTHGSESSASAQTPNPEEIKTATVHRISSELLIDGELSEPEWRSAPLLGPFVAVRSGLFDPKHPLGGSARLLWSDSFLYVAFEVRDPDLRGGFPDNAVDPHLWERDTVELMIDPLGDGDNRDYFELQISPQNLAFDSRFDDYNRPRGGPDGPFGHEAWSSQRQSAVVLDGTLDDPSDVDRGYTVELRVPWASFTPQAARPQSGESWRMNLYAMENNGGVAWSPILGQGNFHKAARFGRVTFVD